MMHLTEPGVATPGASPAVPVAHHARGAGAEADPGAQGLGKDIDRYLPLSTYRLLRKHSVADTP